MSVPQLDRATKATHPVTHRAPAWTVTTRHLHSFQVCSSGNISLNQPNLILHLKDRQVRKTFHK